MRKKSTCSMLKSQCSNCFYIEKKNYHKAYSSRLICQLPPPYVVRVLKIIFFFSYSNLFILQFSDILGEKNVFSLFLKKKVQNIVTIIKKKFFLKVHIISFKLTTYRMPISFSKTLLLRSNLETQSGKMHVF